MNRRIVSDVISEVNDIIQNYGSGELGLTIFLVATAFYSAQKMMEDNSESRNFISREMVPYRVPEQFSGFQSSAFQVKNGTLVLP